MPRTRASTGQRSLGAHMSTSGGFPKAVAQSARVDATAVQIFTKSQLRWKSTPISPGEAGAFREAVASSPLRFVCVHDSYLINLAATADDLREKSVASLTHELERGETLGCACLVMHPGAAKDDPREVGIQRIAEGLRRALKATAGMRIRIAIENTAGQGTTLGVRFAEIAAMIRGAGGDPRLGVCLDTCHAFAAGYELRTAQGVAAMLDEFEREIGLGRLLMLHLNDSKKEFASHLDRHEHIGKGCIGEDGFRNVLREPRLRGIPGIIETPKDEKTDPELNQDRANLELLRKLEAG